MNEEKLPDRLQNYLPWINPSGGDESLLVRDPWEIVRIEGTVADRYRARNWDPSWAETGLFYEDPYCRLFRDAVIFPGGREVIHHRVQWKAGPVSGVAMLPRFQGQFVLVGHYRHPIQMNSWECPRGGTSTEECLEETVRKEMLEEIGGVVSSCRRLGHMTPINSFTDAGVDLFLVELSEIGQPHRGEGIEHIRLVSQNELITMLVRGEITDASTISAVAHALFQNLMDEPLRRSDDRP